jgi:TPR repeat protein
MDYYNKYLKYKTKYLNLKYDNNQFGGAVQCEKGHSNFLGTCWAVSLLMILSFGHLTSNQLNEKNQSFRQGDDSITEIKKHIEKFIEQRITEIQSNEELTNTFMPYDIFHINNIHLVKEILRKFIERYYNKFMNIQFTPKLQHVNPTQNQERCEKIIATNYKNLFNTNHIIITESFGGTIYDEYLFCNLLSIFFLDYKVSFTNYYDNFNTINFKDENDLGILIKIHNHVCCLFICNGKQKFYNDNDKYKKIYDYNWKDLLQQEAIGNKLYIVDNHLKYIEDIKSYMDKSTSRGDARQRGGYPTPPAIFKVEFLTVISKYDKKDTTLDKDIKTALIGNQLATIKDKSLLTIIGKQILNKGQNEKDKETVSLGVQMISLAAAQDYDDALYYLADMFLEGNGVVRNYKKAKEMFALIIEHVDINTPNILLKLKTAERLDKGYDQYKLAINLLETNVPSNIDTGIKSLKEAADNQNALAFMKLGEIYQEGILVNKDLGKAKEWYTKGYNISDNLMSQVSQDSFSEKINILKIYSEDVHYKLGIKLLDSGEIDKGVHILKEAAANDSTSSFMKLGELCQEGRLVNKDLVQAKQWYLKAYHILYDDLQFKKKIQTKIEEIDTMLIVKQANEGNIPAIFKLGHLLETDYNNLVDRDIPKAKELYTKGANILKDNPSHPNYTEYYQKFIKHIHNIEAKQIETDILVNSLHSKLDCLLNKWQNKFDKNVRNDISRNDISDIIFLGLGYNMGHWGKKDLAKAKEIYTQGAKLVKNMPEYKSEYSMCLERIDQITILISNALNRPNVFA